MKLAVELGNVGGKLIGRGVKLVGQSDAACAQLVGNALGRRNVESDGFQALSVGKHLFRSALRENAPLVQNDDAAAELRQVLHAVRNHHNR